MTELQVSAESSGAVTPGRADTRYGSPPDSSDREVGKRRQAQPPPGPRFVDPPPWAHQLSAYEFAYPLAGAMLAMDMGVGKSRVAVDLIVNRGHKRVLVVCPKAVIAVWPAQIARWAAEPVSVLALDKGLVKKKTEMAKAFLAGARGIAVVVINYESGSVDPFDKWAMTAGFDLVIADECHAIKSPSGKRSRWMSRLGARTPYRLGLTGTPMPHSPLDLYAQYRFVAPQIFGVSNTLFKRQWGEFGGFEGRVFQRIIPARETEFTKRFYSVAFRVAAGDVLDLPPTIDITRTAPMGAAGARVYADLETQYHAWLDEGYEVTVANALVKLLRLQQCTSGFVGDDEGELRAVDSAKAELLAEVLDELSVDEPVVVFARFTADLAEIRRVAESQGRRYGELSGHANDLTDSATMPDDVDVLGVQIQAGGLGIDLTRAAYCIWYSVGFSNGEFRQARARLDRPGQTRSVRYIALLCEHTIDARIFATLAGRENVVRALMCRESGSGAGEQPDPLREDRSRELHQYPPNTLTDGGGDGQ